MRSKKINMKDKYGFKIANNGLQNYSSKIEESKVVAN